METAKKQNLAQR